MLTNTFIHFPGFGAKTEQELWRSGVLTWEGLEKRHYSQLELQLNDHKVRPPLLASIQESITALKSRHANYFAERLPPSEHYRIALAFPAETAFLDIETTGLSIYYDNITVIGLLKANRYHFAISGTKKHGFDAVGRALESAKCLVTFNGTLFDLKFIRKTFPDLNLPKAHVDLRYFGRRLGYNGTQKSLEIELGIRRSNALIGVDGQAAPILWHRYVRGDHKQGKLLVLYNRADVEGLAQIFAKLVASKLAQDGMPRRAQEALRYFTTKQRAKPKEQSAVRVGKYSGVIGPRIHLNDLLAPIAATVPPIVGIDLTGSETRPSGWALIRDKSTETMLIRSDDDIVSITIAARPQLVSIDSPLSIPIGRVSVDDNDPTRDTYGIMRECERILKRRGINVYPCLLPSMQKLTARGMVIARRLRAMGVPVIESYPGAAQDILGIPRKRQSLEFLGAGLKEFGLNGCFSADEVSHDELDAITSALVGLFFWFGRFERLGNEVEDYLIIPDLRVDPRAWLTRDVIGFSGPIAAGKTTAARFLEQKGYAYQRFSHVLSELMKKRGMEVSRVSLQDFGEQISHTPGQSWFCRRVAQSLGGAEKAVIDGMRFPEDAAGLVEWFGPGFRHIHIEAPAKDRESRYVKRDGNKREFIEASNHAVERRVDGLASLAQLLIVNDGSMEDFGRKLAAVAG